MTGHLVIILMCFSWSHGMSLGYGIFVHMIYVFSEPGDQWQLVAWLTFYVFWSVTWCITLAIVL